MNTAQLWKCVRQDELLNRYCTGIYASDTVPTKFSTSLPICYIMNTDPIALPGTHWVAVYLSLYDKHEFFDSYGRKQSVIAPVTRSRRPTEWIENTTTLQSPFSTTCGQYYLSERCAGRTMLDIINDFSCTQDLIENDELINNYINTVYNTELDIYDEKFDVIQTATMF